MDRQQNVTLGFPAPGSSQGERHLHQYSLSGGGGSLDSQGGYVPYFAQLLVGEECAQSCDHGLPRMFWITELMMGDLERNEQTKTLISLSAQGGGASSVEVSS